MKRWRGLEAGDTLEWPIDSVYKKALQTFPQAEAREN